MEDYKPLIKDIECLHCEKFFDCLGRVERTPCLNFKEREKYDTRSRYERLYDSLKEGGENNGRKANDDAKDNG